MDDQRAPTGSASSMLAAYPPGSPSHEHALAKLEGIARTPGGAEARWLLGSYFLQVSTRPHAHAQALQWLQLSAADGTAPAVDRLADLCLSGLAGKRSPQQALELHQSLADQGYQRSAWDAAYLRLSLGGSDGIGPVTAFLRACALGDPRAYMALGWCFLEGAHVARDVAFGHALLRRASDGGCTMVLPAIDTDVDPGDIDRWHGVLRDNLHSIHDRLSRLVPGRPGQGQRLHPMLPLLEKHLVAIAHPAIGLDAYGRAEIRGADGNAVPEVREWMSLSEAPRISICRQFATSLECAHLIAKVAPTMRPARDYRRGNSANEDAELQSFSGRGHPIGPMQTDAVTRTLEQRLSAMTGYAPPCMEPCSIICYRPGEEYLPHVDFFSNEQMRANVDLRRDYGGQRDATFLLYLLAPALGGETEYIEPRICLRGEQGMGVVHYNVTKDGLPDAATLHRGNPILSGEKWLWRSTLRSHSLYEQRN